MLRERLVYKLFFVLLATAVVVAVAMSLLIGWSFTRGFQAYVDAIQGAQMGQLEERLQQAYVQAGGWDFLRGQPQQWRRMLRPGQGGAADGAFGVPSDPFAPPPGGAFGQPPWQGGGQGWGGRPGWQGAQWAAPGGPPFPRGGGPHGPGSQPRDPYMIGPRMVLLDEERNHVAGPRPTAETTLRPLRVDGATVGWLGMAPLSGFAGREERRFMERQTHAFYWIALLVVALAGSVAPLLARRLLRPVKALAGGAHALAKGHYDVRIPVETRDELGRLAVDFNRLARTLESNETSRRRWIADISHELRTPLAVLRGEIEALQDGIRRATPEALQSLHGEVLQLAKLVDDLYQLALSDLGALNYEKRQVEPLEVLVDVASGFEGRYAQAGLALEIPEAPAPGPMAFADAQRLGQLFHNLLENGLRYTDSGGRMRLGWDVTEGVLAIDFQDSTPAVPDEALPKLFDRLYRVDESRGRAKGGAGLGLAICRNIVDAHDGTIVAQPSPLGGLWVRVTLPLSE